MARYLLKRILVIVPMLLAITFMTFFVISLTPGGPAAGLMGDLNPKVSPEVLEQRKKDFNFDKPFYVQYGLWIKKIVRLDFGRTLKDDELVSKKILERTWKTVLLAVISVIVSFLIAILIGLTSAIKQNSWFDRVMSIFVLTGYSVPFPWIALLALIFFGIHLGWLPMTGFESLNADEMTWLQRVWDVAKHLVLPVLVGSIASLAALSRYMRNQTLEVIRQDYVRTATAKGLSKRRVLFAHIFRNSLIPLVTILGLTLPDLFSGSVILENIFSYPGLGRLIYEAYMTRDMNLIMASVLMASFLTLVGNLIADVTYAAVDPRIRYQ